MLKWSFWVEKTLIATGSIQLLNLKWCGVKKIENLAYKSTDFMLGYFPTTDKALPYSEKLTHQIFLLLPELDIFALSSIEYAFV